MPKKKKETKPKLLSEIKTMIFDFLAQHRGIIYEPNDLQPAMIAHNYPVKDINPDCFRNAIDELIAESKIQLYVRLT